MVSHTVPDSLILTQLLSFFMPSADPIVASSAQRAQIASFQSQVRAISKRNNMIHDACRIHSTNARALFAEWIARQYRRSQSLPLACLIKLIRFRTPFIIETSNQTIMQRRKRFQGMCRTAPASIHSQLLTTGITTYSRRTIGHSGFLIITTIAHFH